MTFSATSLQLYLLFLSTALSMCSVKQHGRLWVAIGCWHMSPSQLKCKKKNPDGTVFECDTQSKRLLVCFYHRFSFFWDLHHGLMEGNGYDKHSIWCVTWGKATALVWVGRARGWVGGCNCVSSTGTIMSALRAVVFVMPYGEVKMLFKSRKCVKSNSKQFLVQRMTEIYCVPLACLDQVAGEALFGQAVTDCADSAPSFRRPAEQQPAASGAAAAMSQCRKHLRRTAKCNCLVF